VDEKKQRPENQFRPGIGLRFKIILTFFIINVVVSGFLAVASYLILQTILTRELFTKLSDMSRMGSAMIDIAALKQLARQAAKELPDDEIARLEQSVPYKKISDELNYIRDVEKRLIRFVYTFIPTQDENTALFLVDADLLAALQSQDEKEVSHYASVFDLGDFEKAREIIKTNLPVIDREFVHDAAFNVNSVSGYAPIKDDQGVVIAYLGIDMTDTDVRAALADVTLISALISLASLVLTLASSVVLGTLFTRGIINLDRVVRKFGDREMNVRAEIKSKDEVGRLGNSFNQMAVTIETYARELEALLGAYGKFVPHKFLRFLEKKSITDVKLGDQVLREMTILFSDIRSFTALSETMTPQENFNFINSFLSQVGPEIRAHNGFIDKYIGDAVMALFPDSASDGVRAAIAMQRKVVGYNEGRARQGYVPIRIGVGLNTGNLMLGTVGEQERMDGTVISDAVNLCSRLEGLTKKYDARILVSADTLKHMDDRASYRYRFIDKVQVLGKKKSIDIYEICDADPDEEQREKMENRDTFYRGVKLYFNRKFEEALKVFGDLSGRHSHDALYALYAQRSRQHLEEGIPEDWDGVEVFDSK
jgi:class 3 adenylate cyclase/HAMP domain-containing protein